MLKYTFKLEVNCQPALVLTERPKKKESITYFPEEKMNKCNQIFNWQF